MRYTIRPLSHRFPPTTPHIVSSSPRTTSQPFPSPPSIYPISNCDPSPASQWAPKNWPSSAPHSNYSNISPKHSTRLLDLPPINIYLAFLCIHRIQKVASCIPPSRLCSNCTGLYCLLSILKILDPTSPPTSFASFSPCPPPYPSSLFSDGGFHIPRSLTPISTPFGPTPKQDQEFQYAKKSQSEPLTAHRLEPTKTMVSGCLQPAISTSSAPKPSL